MFLLIKNANMLNPAKKNDIIVVYFLPRQVSISFVPNKFPGIPKNC